MGILLGFFVYPNINKNSIECLYVVNPIRTKIVTTENTSELVVLYHGKNLGSTNITAIQVAIWNSGDVNLKQGEGGNVIGDVVITIDPSAKLLAANITKNEINPKITKLIIDNSPDNLISGKIPVHWNILQKGNGVSVQLVFEGNPDAEINVEGYIEYFGEIKELKYEEPVKWQFFLFSGISILFILFSTTLVINSFLGDLPSLVIYIIVIIFVIVFLGFGVNNFIDSITSVSSSFGPPFGF